MNVFPPPTPQQYQLHLIIEILTQAHKAMGSGQVLVWSCVNVQRGYVYKAADV
jgi:hypothetical protein